MSQLLTIPAALATSGPTACPSWCTQHDHDVQMHNATPIRRVFEPDTRDLTAVRTADVFLDADLGDDTATVRVVINRGEMFQLPAADAVALALAILAQAGEGRRPMNPETALHAVANGDPDALHGSDDRGTALFQALIYKARPGITRAEAENNGRKFQTAIAGTDVNDVQWRQWQDRLVGYCLIVHLDGHGAVCGTKLPLNQDANKILADNPGTVLVATWEAGR